MQTARLRRPGGYIVAVELVLQLARSKSAPHEARLFVEQHLAHVSPTVCQDVVLLVSELVTNVVRHGEEPASLHLSIDAETISIVVRDSGPDLPVEPGSTLPDARAATGRGLIIVAALSTAWGVRRSASEQGKEVWFDVAV